MSKKIKIVEMFSGIGSQATALKNIGYNVDVLNTCEWDMQVFVAYCAIHNNKVINPIVNRMTKEEILNDLNSFSLSNDGKRRISKRSLRMYSYDNLVKIYSSILLTNNLIDISKVSGNDIGKNVDLLTYSFPCQDLSNVGQIHGYNKGIDKGSGSRSSLLWEIGRILREIKSSHHRLPKYLVMENVPTLLSKRHIKNFNKWINDLEKLGYVSKYYKLNAADFGIPQNRQRLLMLSIYVGHNKAKKKRVMKYFSETNENKIVKDYRNSKYYKKRKIKDLLRNDYSVKKYYEEAIHSIPNDTPSRRYIWKNNPKLVNERGRITNRKYIRTITTKQDRHPNSGNIYINTRKPKKSKYRFLTPRECMLFMGFKDSDYEQIIKSNSVHKNTEFFSRDKIVRMAGNSIPVQLLEGFFYQIELIDKKILKY